MVDTNYNSPFVQLLRWDKNKKKGVEILLRITSFCNLRCRYCFSRENFGSPSVNELFKTLKFVMKRERIRSDSTVLLNITGGEPLVRRDLFEILVRFGHIFENHSVNIQTNATLITKEVAKRLYRYNVKSAFVGLAALNNQDYVKLTGLEGGFTDALTGIHYLIDAGIEVCLNFVLSKVVIDDFLQIPEFVISEFGNFVSVNLSTLSPGTPEDFLKKYGVSYPYAAMLFEKIYKKLKMAGISYGAFGGDCSPVICAFKNKEIRKMYSFASSPLEIKYSSSFNDIKDGFRYKSILCKQCCYNRRCIGVSSVYARVFKDRNYRPIK